MTCLFDPTQYRGNLHDRHTRPSSMPYPSPCGNCHHKETSPTTGDQTQLPPKIIENNLLNMSTRTWSIISSYLSIWERCTKIQPHTHGPLQSIRFIKVKPGLSTNTKPQYSYRDPTPKFQEYHYRTNIVLIYLYCYPIPCHKTSKSRKWGTHTRSVQRKYTLSQPVSLAQFTNLIVIVLYLSFVSFFHIPTLLSVSLVF